MREVTTSCARERRIPRRDVTRSVANGVIAIDGARADRPASRSVGGAKAMQDAPRRASTRTS